MLTELVYGTTRKERAELARKFRAIQQEANVLIDEIDQIIFNKLLPEGEEVETFE